MKRLLACGLLALSLGGCANLKQSWEDLASSSVPANGVIVAANSFDAVESVATSYLTFCKANRGLSVCSSYVQIRKQLLPAVRSARVARVNLENFQQQNPGQLGASGLYNALQSAIATVQAIITKYKVTPNGVAS